MLMIIQRRVLVDTTPTSERKIGCEQNDQMSVVAIRLVHPIGTSRSASPFFYSIRSPTFLYVFGNLLIITEYENSAW